MERTQQLLKALLQKPLPHAVTTGILSPHVIPLKISEQCYYTLKRHYLQPWTYQFHQMMHFTSTDTYAPTSWL